MREKIFLCLLCLSTQALATTPTPAHSIGETLPANNGGATDPHYPEINWSDLIPKNWDTEEKFRQFNFAQYKDNDPAANTELKKLQEAFAQAPIIAELNGKNITLSGFMVPLDANPETVTEFLLVPFYGACIHVPPPPANQIIYVKPKESVKGLQSMAAITIKGTLETQHSNTRLGSAGYVMQKAEVIPYATKTCLFAPTCN